MSKQAFITGAYGQDGSYLAEYLLSGGYEVVGLVHKNDTKTPVAELLRKQKHFTEHIADLADVNTYADFLNDFAPDELYSIAAISDLKTALRDPEKTMSVNYEAVRDIVEIASSANTNVRIFQALSSRLLTPDEGGVIRETSVVSNSENPYDIAKRKSLEDVIIPKRKEGIFICGGYLCNHESPRRDERFVTGKIVKMVTDIKKGHTEKLAAGNVNAKRDWSFAGDTVRAMHATLQAETPDDYVIGSGELRSVRDFIDIAFSVIEMPLSWEGDGFDTKAFDEEGILRFEVSPEFYQEDDNPVVADITKITDKTDWKPEVSFEALVKMMVQKSI